MKWFKTKLGKDSKKIENVSPSTNEKNNNVVYKVGGKGPAGGWVFYDKGDFTDGWRYLEAAPVDQATNAEWGICERNPISNAISTAIGTGKSNTEAIIKEYGSLNIAAKICTEYHGGGKSDWFLPSKDELNEMYINLHKKGIGNFTNNGYWSSSDHDIFGAKYHDFNGSKQIVDFKNRPAYVRAVRAF